MNSPLSKIPQRFQAPVKAALQALTAPADLSDAAVNASQDVSAGGRDPLQDRLRKPMIIGAAVVGVFVVLAGIWAGFTKIEGAVTAPAVVRSEFNRRTLRPREGGTVEALFVHEGALVKKGQVLMQFTPIQPQAAVDITRNQTYSAQAQAARFEAEMTGKPAIVFPPELVERAKTDVTVAGLMRDQVFVFQTRHGLINEQREVYRQQAEQLKARIGGLQLQIQANEQSAALVREQLKGYQTLYEKGFAPRNQILNLQRTLSDLGGQRGANIAEVTRTQEQIGEVTANLAKLTQQIQTEAAEGLRDSQVRVADAVPRLRAAEEALESSTVRSPIDGYVLGLTQFTIGAAVGGGERLMDIVPANEPLLIEARIKPTDIDQAKIGGRARVLLTAYNSRMHAGVNGVVSNVSADMISTPEGAAYFRVDVRVTPQAMAESGNRDVKLGPGMPATVMLLTGKRSILSYLMGPFIAPVEKALRED